MTEAIKVLSLVSYKFLPPDMGGQKGIAFFNRYLAKNCDLLCITTKSNRNFQSEGYPIKNILSNSSFRYINPFYFFKLSGIIRKEKITHVIIEHPYYGWLGILLKWFCKIKLIVHSHNIESYRFKSMKKWWWGILWNYEKLTHRNATVSFFISDEDREFACRNFALNHAKCHTITYGFEISEPPLEAKKNEAKKILQDIYKINETEKILLFNGTLNYQPNLDALDIILQHINPMLLSTNNFNYKIIICGKSLPPEYNGLKEYVTKNIIYAGFVDDINLYFKGADIFINPVTDGGGIKTKVVEALGYNVSCISTRNGAIGIPVSVTGKKLDVIENKDWQQFTKAIVNASTSENIPEAFYIHFYWGNIASKAAKIINDTN